MAYKTVTYREHVNKDEINILDPGQTKWDFIRHIVSSGDQKDAFLVINLDDIVRKHREWIQKLPRVTPFYGKMKFLIALLPFKID